MNFQVANIIATAKFGNDIKLPLELIYRSEKRSWYCKDIFSGLHLHLKRPTVTVTVFANGKMNIVGAKSLADAKRATAIAARRIRKACIWSAKKRLIDDQTAEAIILGVIDGKVTPVSPQRPKDMRVKDFRIVNIVGTTQIPEPLDMKRIHDDHKTAFYEPELLNGLQFKLKFGNISVTVFHSGKLYATGFPNLESYECGMKYIYEMLTKYCVQK